MGNNKKQRLIIIDGNALIHRSFHALPPTMATKDGRMVNAVYGFTTVLIKAIKEFKPEYVVLTLDKKGPTFRHKEYEKYKATRVKAPDELYEQIPLVKEVAKVLQIPVFEQEGFEADDLIGTIASQVDGEVEKIIVTGDLDTLQLVNDHVKVYTMSRGLSDSVVYDAKAVEARYGLTPGQMIDYKALRGDPSDNIPGVRGIGEKTATELLGAFKTLEALYDNLDSQQAIEKIKPRIIELLKTHKEEAFLSKRLATIKCDVKIALDLPKARFGRFNQAEVVKLFSDLEFKSLLVRIKDLAVSSSSETEAGAGMGKISAEEKLERNKKLFAYVLVDDDKKFAIFLAKLKKQKAFAIDTETASLDVFSAELLGISFSWKKGEAYFLEVKSDQPKIQNNLFDYQNSRISGAKARQKWLDGLKPILEDEKIKKYGHNIKFDLRVLQNAGINMAGLAFDSMIAAYLLNPGTRQHNLDAVAFTELGFEKISKDDLLGTGVKKQDFSEVAVEKLFLYSCEDADFTFRLAAKLKEELKNNQLDELFDKIEMPLVPVLAEMENTGIRLDEKFLGKLHQETSEAIAGLEKKIKKLAGVDFNINSTQQLREILFVKLAIPTDMVAKTKTGLSTATEELEKIKDLHPIVGQIQEYRELAKLESTYISALPELVNKKTGRLHSTFNQTVAATGRLSSSNPNLQNIPIRTELGREIRKAFVADEGYELLSLDYSQIELRLAAHMSGDPKMIKAFKENKDIHTATAAEINGIPLDKVTPEMRREAKAINFGILYGQGPHGLSKAADIPYGRAKEFIDEYFKVYKNIKEYVDETVAGAREKGYVETLFGRRRYLPEINSSVAMVKKGAERMAVNMPIQGTAADMIKAAMIDVFKFLKHNNDARLLLQVHDELLFEVKESSVKEMAEKIKQIMEKVIKLKVPIIAEMKAGKNWGEMKKIKPAS